MNIFKRIYEILKQVDFVLDLLLALYEQLSPEDKAKVKSRLKDPAHVDRLG